MFSYRGIVLGSLLVRDYPLDTLGVETFACRNFREKGNAKFCAFRVDKLSRMDLIGNFRVDKLSRMDPNMKISRG